MGQLGAVITRPSENDLAQRAWSAERNSKPCLELVSAPGLPVANPRVANPRVAKRRHSPEVLRRRRLVAALGVAVIMVFALVLGTEAGVAGALFGGGPLAASEQSSPLPQRGTVVVGTGDTFWSIARRIHPEGDVRPLVDALVSKHGGVTLQVGERLAY